MLPPGSSVCSRDGARGVAANPFSEDEATVRRDSAESWANGQNSGSRPVLTAAPLEAMEPADENTWEATVNRDVLVGKQLGDFVVKRRIGAGGMGIVYEGEHPIIGRKVAIKILRPEFSEGGGARDLIAEARAASAIRHRGIIDVFGFGTIPHVGQYLVMEYLEGAPLDEIIGQRAPMLEAEVIALLDELLGALAAAHAVGVIHRDLKPGNIFVVRDSSGGEAVKVLDFGLAKRSEIPHGTSPQTRASMIVGTPEYMAPEQATGQAVGPHTDLYSVGVIAFEMLTRRLPFEGPSAMAIAIQHVQAKPPAPSTYVDIHPALDKLVLRMLAKTAAERPASAEAARRELKAISKQLADGATRLETNPKGEKATDLVPRIRTNERKAWSEGAPAPAPRNSRPVTGTTTAAAGSSGSQTLLEMEAAEEISARPTNINAPSTDRIPAVRSNRRIALGAVALLGLAGLGFWALHRVNAPDPARVEPATNPSEVAVNPANPNPTPGPVVPPTIEPPKPPPEDPNASKVAQQTGNPAQDTQKPPERAGMAQTGRLPSTRPNTGMIAQKRPGALHLSIKGWAFISVDGKDKGQVPPTNDLELPPGVHMLVLTNPKAQPYVDRIEIKAGELLEKNFEITAGKILEKKATSKARPGSDSSEQP